MHSSAYIFDWIFFILAGTCDKDNCKVLCQFKTGQIQPCTAELAALDRVKKSLTYLSSIQNILSTCWLSGEQSLPSGLLVHEC